MVMRLERNLNEILKTIELEGSKTFRLIRLTQLLYKEKAKNISDVGTKRLYNFIKGQNCFAAPSLEEILQNHHRDERITLTLNTVKRSTVFFDKESDLEDFITNNSILETQLKFNKNIDRQIKLIGAKDKVDFIAIKDKQKYLIEIKHKTSYYGIEQLLRYKGISKEDSCKMILITGIEDPKLLHTFKGMHKEQRKLFKWYIYDWDGKDTFKLNKIMI